MYLLGGFLALPAIVKWQLEKQVPAQLGHTVSVGKVRFNPLLFRFEVDDLAFADPDGRPLLAFKRLLIDFELRSVIDRAWTFAEVRLEAPMLNFALDKDGRHKFASLLERLPASEPDVDQGLPRFLVQRVALSEARIEFSDHWHNEPLVAQIAPLSIIIDNLSSLPEAAASYRLSAQTAAGEILETSGDLALNPIVVKGKLKLGGLQVATLVRSLPRLLAIDSPAGKVDLGASFDLAIDTAGTLSGVVQDVNLNLTSLSLSAAGSAEPLLTMATLSLQQGRVDLTAHRASLGGLRLAEGNVVVAFDERGKLNWEKLLRVAASRAEVTSATETDTTEQPKAAVAMAPATAPVTDPVVPAGETTDAVVPGAWWVTIGTAEVSAVALAYADPAQALVIDVATLALETAPSVEFAIAGMRVELAQPKLSLARMRLKRGSESLMVSNGQIAAGQITIDIADARFDLVIDQPQTIFDGFKAQSGADGIDLGKLTIAGQTLSLSQASDGLDLVIDKVQGGFDGVAARRGADAVTLKAARLASDKLSLAQAVAETRVKARAAQLSASGLAAQQGADRITWQDASFDASKIVAALGGASPAATSTDLRFDGVALKLKALAAVALDAPSEIAQIAAANLGAKSLTVALPKGPIDVRGDGLSLALSDAVFRSPADPATEMLRLGRANISGGVLRLKDQVVTVDKVAIADGAARTWLDTEGKFNGLIVTRGAAAAAAEAAPGAAGSDAAWRLAVKSTEVDDFALAFEDRSGGPLLAIGLESITARVTSFETGVSTPMHVDLKAKVASGGDIEAKGTVRADDGTSDLQLKLVEIALAPVQPLVSEFTTLTVASGTASSSGRLRYGDPAVAGAKLAYKGSFVVDKLQIDEVEPKRPFVTWDKLTTDDLLLTVEPNLLDVGELQIVQPTGRLIIAEDQSINLTDVLKKSKDGEQVAGEAPAAATAGDEGVPTEDPFPVTVARIRVSKGALEFADLSLRPQFRTRMHELQGVITGLGTDPARSAKVQLDARVDKYGSAKIRGQISVFHPAKLTDIEMTFRNLTLSSLSPYGVKFAGRRITGGQLSLDLQYKVKERKLRGENKIVLKQVKLGERVDTPGAADLPLDLAIAILSDSQGVIDIGLPVSGDLNNPEFAYGAVIGKAFGSLLTGIVTAPFKALGALFGASSDSKLDSIDFEPGSAVLAPPEREKLATVARAMKERTMLTLVVPPTHSVETDTAALKSLAVRSDIVGRMGLELQPGEDPGPVDAANPRAQVAIEAAFSERYAPEVLALVKQRALATAPTAFYQGLLERMIKEQPVSDEALAQLASQRGEAIVAEMTSIDGVDVKRVLPGKPRQASAASDKAVTLQLELEVAK